MPVFDNIRSYLYSRRMRRAAKRVLKDVYIMETKSFLAVDINTLDPDALAMDPDHPTRLLQQFPEASPAIATSLAAFFATFEKARRAKIYDLCQIADAYARCQSEIERVQTVYDENGDLLTPDRLAGELSAKQNDLSAQKRKMTITFWVAGFFGHCLVLFIGFDAFIIFETQRAYFGEEAFLPAIALTSVFIAVIGLFTCLGTLPLFNWAVHISKATPGFVPPTRSQIRLWLGSSLATIATCFFIAIQRAHVYLDEPTLSESVMNLLMTSLGLPVVAVIAHLLYDLFVERIRKYADFKNEFDQMLTLTQATERESVRAMVGLRKSTPLEKQAKRLIEEEFEDAKKAAYHDLCRLPMLSSEIDRFARLIAEPKTQGVPPNSNASAAPQIPPIHTIPGQTAPVPAPPGPTTPAPTPTSVTPVQATGQTPPPAVVPAVATPLNIIGSVSKNGTVAANSKGQTTP